MHCRDDKGHMTVGEYAHRDNIKDDWITGAREKQVPRLLVGGGTSNITISDE
jgi:hypothetical protein